MVKSKRVTLLSRWNENNEMTCACLTLNPLCIKNKKCEEIEVTIKPYEDIEQCLKNQKSYKRHRGALRQR